jgi:hypothetical protein
MCRQHVKEFADFLKMLYWGYAISQLIETELFGCRNMKHAQASEVRATLNAT